MIVDKNNGIVTITHEKGSLQQLLKKVDAEYKKFEKNHIIINLFSFSSLSQGDLLEFLEVSNQHRKNKHSFVLVTDRVSFDQIPEELVVVPTLQEAHDLIEMEEIERDLGF